MKSGQGVVQCYWKWNHSTDRIRVPISVLWRYPVSFARYSELLVENR